jgi:hypothetical protein
MVIRDRNRQSALAMMGLACGRCRCPALPGARRGRAVRRDRRSDPKICFAHGHCFNSAEMFRYQPRPCWTPRVRVRRVPAGAQRPAAGAFRVPQGPGPSGSLTTSSLVRAQDDDSWSSGFESHVVSNVRLPRTLACYASQANGKPAASLFLQLNIEAPAEMAAGERSVAALCADADTALGSEP